MTTHSEGGVTATDLELARAIEAVAQTEALGVADAVRGIELRVLDGPNLYFPRPAIKLTLAVPGWMRASEARVTEVATRLEVSGAATPGAPGSQHRRRFVARIAAQLTRRQAVASGARRLAVKGTPGNGPDQIVVAFPWRRRAAAEALARRDRAGHGRDPPAFARSLGRAGGRAARRGGPGRRAHGARPRRSP